MNTEYERITNSGKKSNGKIQYKKIEWLSHVWKLGKEVIIKLPLEWKKKWMEEKRETNVNWVEGIVEVLTKTAVNSWQESVKEKKVSKPG